MSFFNQFDFRCDVSTSSGQELSCVFPWFFFFCISVTDSSTIQRYFARFQEKFFQFCDKELAKINTFFLGESNNVSYHDLDLFLVCFSLATTSSFYMAFVLFLI